MMSVAKIAVSIDSHLLEKLDNLVAQKTFKSRSQAIQVAVTKTVARFEHIRLAQECERLDSALEQQLADEGLEKDAEEWPEF